MAELFKIRTVLSAKQRAAVAIMLKKWYNILYLYCVPHVKPTAITITIAI